VALFELAAACCCEPEWHPLQVNTENAARAATERNLRAKLIFLCTPLEEFPDESHDSGMQKQRTSGAVRTLLNANQPL
ncbi:MAG: hypothetical protein ACRD25_01355, partial [Terracidiphilus sp.]